jgi:hypothetical protein
MAGMTRRLAMALSVAAPFTVEHPVDVYAAARVPPGRVQFLEVPASRYLAVDGRGAPGEVAFRDAMAALYPVAWTLHFDVRKRLGASPPVGALEGLYWVEPDRPLPMDLIGTESWLPKDWHWRLMLPVPTDGRGDEIVAAIDKVAASRNPRSLGLLRVIEVKEGLSAQVLHVGPYDAEQPTLVRLRDAIRAAGLRPHGCHHEIYRSDPGRTTPDRLKTVIRQPVER